MSINITLENNSTLKPKIVIMGVGGAGNNAVNNMISSNMKGVDFWIANTDAQALENSKVENKIQLGMKETSGLGAGSNPEIGRIAAQESYDEIASALEDCNMLFITAGMGGGTGTGAAAVVASIAREKGIMTVGVVTKPFHFEGGRRMKVAEQGLEELTNCIDTLIVIPNQNLFRVANEKTTFADAFKKADDVLHAGVMSITDLIVMPGLINLDFADIKTVMNEMGKAMMGTGEAEGEERAIKAAEAAISNPILDNSSMKGARGVLINITGGEDMTLFEVDAAANRIKQEVDPSANIIFGSAFNEKLSGKIKVSVVATGIDLEEAKHNSSINNHTKNENDTNSNSKVAKNQNHNKKNNKNLNYSDNTPNNTKPNHKINNISENHSEIKNDFLNEILNNNKQIEQNLELKPELASSEATSSSINEEYNAEKVTESPYLSKRSEQWLRKNKTIREDALNNSNDIDQLLKNARDKIMKTNFNTDSSQETYNYNTSSNNFFIPPKSVDPDLNEHENNSINTFTTNQKTNNQNQYTQNNIQNKQNLDYSKQTNNNYSSTHNQTISENPHLYSFSQTSKQNHNSTKNYQEHPNYQEETTKPKTKNTKKEEKKQGFFSKIFGLKTAHEEENNIQFSDDDNNLEYDKDNTQYKQQEIQDPDQEYRSQDNAKKLQNEYYDIPSYLRKK